MMWVRRVVPAAALAAVIALAGCGGGGDNPGTGTGTPSGKEALEDLARLLKDFEQKGQKPPARIAAVQPIEPVFPAAYLGLVRGEIEYAWGMPLNPAEGGQVIAYEKQAESAGGWVLLQDGSVKQMTADEFKAAPKAGKK